MSEKLPVVSGKETVKALAKLGFTARLVKGGIKYIVVTGF